MKRIIQIVTEKSERKAVQDPGIHRGLIIYINTCRDLLFDDGWTSRAAGWSSWTHGV